MKRIIASQNKVVLAIAALVLTVVLGAGVASAQNPHFLRAGASGPDNDGDLTCTFKIAGFGNLPTGSTVEVDCSATAAICEACKNNGGGFPSDPKKQLTTTDVNASGNFPVGSNGQVTGGLVLSPPSGALDCPNGQTVVPVSVTYTNVQISQTDTNPDAGTVNVAGTFSKTLESNPRAQCTP